MASLPQGLRGWLPPDVRPSPPPIGWSTGFIATPRTVGRMPRRRLRPALPNFTPDQSPSPTAPTVAMQRTETRRISPEGRRSVAIPLARAISVALVPALRTICAPLPGTSSTLCTAMPSGIFSRGSALPTVGSASGPETTVMPGFSPSGARM